MLADITDNGLLRNRLNKVRGIQVLLLLHVVRLRVGIACEMLCVRTCHAPA